MGKILYSSADVRREIIQLFKSSVGRRVAISAFVGEGADAYLPNPQGLQLICWPKAGGTNPDMLRKLINRGVEVFFADSLHMKLFWSENQGAVLTSANLSTNALGSGGLKEIGILLSSDKFDVDSLISYINPRPVSEVELQELDRRHKLYKISNPSQFKRKLKIRTFREWYNLSGPEWKFGWYDDYGPISSIAKERSMKEYGVAEPKDWLSVKKGQYREGDWILLFKLVKSPTKLQWVSVDYVVNIPKSDKTAYIDEYPCQVVQVYPNNRYPPPPFRINEKKFKKAFSKAIIEFGVKKIKKMKSQKPSKDLLELIYDKYQI